MKPLNKINALLSLRRRILRAHAALERSVARVEEASQPPDEVAEARGAWRDGLCGPKEGATGAITKLQQMQARWVEIELDLLERMDQREDEAEKEIDALDLDVIEREIERRRAVMAKTARAASTPVDE